MHTNNSESNNSTVESILFSHIKNDSIFNTAHCQYRVMELDSKSFVGKWEDYVLQHSESHIYNHPLWFQALEHEFERKGCILVCKDDIDNIKGVLPLLPTLGLPLKLDDLVTTRRYSSLPRTPIGGLLTNDYKAKTMLLNEAMNKVDERDNTTLQLKSYSSDINDEVGKIKQIPWRTSYFVELPDDPEKLRFGNKKSHHKVKWGVKKAKSLGIEVRESNSEDDMRIWYKLYLETMRWHFVAVRPYRFFEFLWKNLYPKGLMTVLLAEDNVNGKKRLLSGSIFLHFNKTFFYSFNGRSQIGLASHANDLIQWEAIQLASKLGYKNYDMGEVSDKDSSLVQFKTKWGCSTQNIYHYYYTCNDKMKLNNIDIAKDLKIAKQIWRKIPLKVTEQWGILTNSFL